MGEHLQASIPWEKHLAKQVEQQHGMTQDALISSYPGAPFFKSCTILIISMFVTGDEKIVCAAGGLI